VLFLAACLELMTPLFRIFRDGRYGQNVPSGIFDAQGKDKTNLWEYTVEVFKSSSAFPDV
jgi:hypothetical protein